MFALCSFSVTPPKFPLKDLPVLYQNLLQLQEEFIERANELFLSHRDENKERSDEGLWLQLVTHASKQISLIRPHEIINLLTEGEATNGTYYDLRLSGGRTEAGNFEIPTIRLYNAWPDFDGQTILDNEQELNVQQLTEFLDARGGRREKLEVTLKKLFE